MRAKLKGKVLAQPTSTLALGPLDASLAALPADGPDGAQQAVRLKLKELENVLESMGQLTPAAAQHRPPN